MKNPKIVIISGIIAFLLLLSIVAGCLIYYRSGAGSTPAVAGNSNQAAQPSPSPSQALENIFFPPTDGKTETTSNADRPWTETTFEIIWRLLLAVILSGILAFRPRKNVPLFVRNLYVAQTQILLAVVAAALMLIVGDNAARAFAIFAAVSLVRFRTNIRDPKEITILLISLSLGLAAGVGRWDLGLALCLFALVLLYVLEFKEPEQVFRSMELTIKTRDIQQTHEAVKKIFENHKLEAEVRQIDPPDEKIQIGMIMFYTNLRLNLSTDYMSNQILEADSENIEGIQWKQKKNAAYIYQ